jgi:hypothetical protein
VLAALVQPGRNVPPLVAAAVFATDRLLPSLSHDAIVPDWERQRRQAVNKQLRLLVGVAGAAFIQASAVSAQNIGPGEPDEVMECFLNGTRVEGCSFSCGYKLNQGGGEQVIWTNVSRVELYHKGSVGRADSRTWVFVANKPAPNPNVPPNIVALYIGPRYYCLGNTSLGGENNKLELRFTKFQFN